MLNKRHKAFRRNVIPYQFAQVYHRHNQRLPIYVGFFQFIHVFFQFIRRKALRNSGYLGRLGKMKRWDVREI